MAPAFFPALLLPVLEILSGLQLIFLSGLLFPGLFALPPLESQGLLGLGSRAGIGQLAADRPLPPLETANGQERAAEIGRAHV